MRAAPWFFSLSFMSKMLNNLLINLIFKIFIIILQGVKNTDPPGVTVNQNQRDIRRLFFIRPTTWHKNILAHIFDGRVTIT